MKKLYLIFFFFMLSKSYASHIIGGDIYYDYLGNNQYRFFITLYRDCNSTGAQYDDPLTLTIYKANNVFFQNILVPFPGSVVLPINFNNPCATPPSNVCVERAIYTTVVTLPPTPGGYDVSYQRCCRGPNITNLLFPDDTGITLTTHVPGSDTGFTANSSPRFTNYPPVLLCNNDELVFDHVATDPDGDQLVYSLVTPWSGASSTNPQPTQAPAPPYFPVQWNGGTFTAQQPLGLGSSTVIDPATGVLVVNPNMIGLYVVGVCVKEYRNGVLVGETIRDFLFRVFDCNIVMQALLPLQTQLPTFVSYCQGLNVQFVNNSYGGTSYAWNFGVPTTTTDVSAQFAPNYTFPSPGNYNVQLIVNPGMSCTDTAYMNVIVNNPLSVSWSSQDSLCILGNNFDFIANVSNPSASLSWVLDPSASQTSGTGNSLFNITFSTPGYHTIEVIADDGFCQLSYVDSIFIFDLPTSIISVPPQVECLGFTVPFGNNSSSAINYSWDFSLGSNSVGQSNATTPTFTFPSPGLYTVQLIASSFSTCSDTSEVQVTIKEPLVMSISHSDSLCIDETFDFLATVSGPSNATFQWDFGIHANPSTSSNLSLQGLSYSQSGSMPVYFIGQYDNCTDTVSSNVRIFGHASIDFMFINTLQCAPSLAQFVNLSQSDVPTQYFWDFGDGNTSTAVNPNHIYLSPGNYSVALTLNQLYGCMDTLYLMQQDLVTVNPSPTAGFMVNPEKVDVCQNTVSFFDQSIGATNYQYVFDNREYTSNLASFTHDYVNAGSDYPIQIVSNQYGCRDTARRTVMVEPFSIYIPNSFIPDENNRNEVFIPVTAFDVVAWDFGIYNRWGELIFQTNDPSQAWDGQINGVMCQDGLYSYKLKFRSCDKPYIWQQVDGFVTLIR
jgi:gliding motility-associated-like protein